jgi:hypothetical protein
MEERIRIFLALLLRSAASAVRMDFRNFPTGACDEKRGVCILVLQYVMFNKYVCTSI